MLTSDLALSWRRGNKTGPKYVDTQNPDHVSTADELIAIVESHVGRTRCDLETAFADYIGSGTDYRVLRGFIKLLLDRCEFDVKGSVDPIDIRREVFRRAKSSHPITRDDVRRSTVIEESARQLGITSEDIRRDLFGDLTSNQILDRFDTVDSMDLLNEYNLAQAQALLYKSLKMTIRITKQDPSSYRSFFSAIKKYRLLNTIHRLEEGGYEVILTGPVSMFHRSQKYGIQMAVFLPTLLHFDGWSFRAEIDSKQRGVAFFDLDSSQRRLVPREGGEDFTHPIVEKMLATIAQLDGDWTSRPSTEVVDLDGETFVPDIIIEREDGRRYPIEVLGFWTPQHIQEKIERCERVGLESYLFAISNDLRASREEIEPVPKRVLLFKTTPDRKSVRAFIEETIGSS